MRPRQIRRLPGSDARGLDRPRRKGLAPPVRASGSGAASVVPLRGAFGHSFSLAGRNTAIVNRPPGFIARRTFANAATGSLKNMIPKRENVSSKLSGREWVDGSVGDDDLRVPHSGSSDPFAGLGYRWLGNICAKDMTARADMLR